MLDPYEVDDANANTGYNRSAESSPWSDFSSNLFGKQGGLLEGAGKYMQESAYSSRFTSMATSMGLKSGAYGMAADWANIGMAFPELQKSLINIQANIQRKQSLEKWQSRISATQARYAKSGIAIDAGMSDTPLKAMLTLLEASDEELRWIDTDKKVREFNEVTMPGIQVRLQQSGAEYNRDLTKIQQNTALKLAKISKTNAYIQGGAKIVGAVGSAYGGAS